jgi:hypothetical protein
MKTELINESEDEKLLSGDLVGRIDLNCEVTPEQAFGLFWLNPRLKQIGAISGYYKRPKIKK